MASIRETEKATRNWRKPNKIILKNARKNVKKILIARKNSRKF